ncbi:MAG: GNAT family N-acetyltransferase [Planctomycetaceae bacterium]
MTLRPYEGPVDLPALQDVVARVLRDRPDLAQFHPGEVLWWICRPAWDEAELRASILIEERDGEIVAWAIDDGEEVLEFVTPRHADALETRFFDGVTSWLADRPGRSVRSAFATDDRTIARLEVAGYRPKPEPAHVTFRRTLAGATEEPRAEVRALRLDGDLTGRCAITYAAFGVDEPFDTYVEGYARFVRSPWYPAGHDLVAYAPDGRAAACCIAWTDQVSGLGAFEPVATHPDLQRSGYGRAVLLAGLRLMVDAGMRAAMVGTPASNSAARALYRSVGFDDERAILAFVR